MTTPLFALALLLVQNTTASLEGFIVKTTTGDAVPNARVILNRIDGSLGEGYSVTASSGGKFLFSSVQPGRYRVFANKNGFVRAEYGQRAPNKPGTEIAITTGQQLKEYNIQMMPTGALAGHVYDMNGEPMPNVDIAALLYKYTEGRRLLTRVQQTRTNDFGEYRLFYLAPGEYFVSATPLDPPRIEGNALVMFSGPGTSADNGQRGLPTGTRIATSGSRNAVEGILDPSAKDHGYLTSYFPGTADPQQATAIRLDPGVNYTGIDFTVAPVRVLHVRGQVVNGRTGQPAPDASVQLVPRQLGPTAATRQASTTSFDSQGTFDIRAVAPGSYRLIGAVSDRGRLTGSILLDLSGDMDNVRLVVNRGFTLPVRFTIEGRAIDERDPDIARMGVNLVGESTGQLVGGSTVRGAGGNAGTFVVQDIAPDDYRIVVLNLPRNSYIKSGRLAGTDVLNSGLRIDTQPNAPLEIVVSFDTGKLDGLVLDGRNQPAANVAAVLVPDANRNKRRELYKSGTTDASGRFHLEGIAPGDYTVFAWEDVESGAWQDPEFVRRYEDRGRRVHIDERGQTSVELNIIPARP